MVHHVGGELSPVFTAFHKETVELNLLLTLIVNLQYVYAVESKRTEGLPVWRYCRKQWDSVTFPL